MMQEETVMLWTQQTETVIDRLLTEGVCQVKREYIESKYEETGWSFLIAYDFFASMMRQQIPVPEGCELPYWLHGTKEGTGVFTAGALAEFCIPVSACLFFDSRDWSRILNLSFLGTPGEEEAFRARLKRNGISHDSEVFRQPYYPLEKQQILSSWQKLFKKRAEIPTDYLQAAVWQLKKEWYCGQV